MVFSSSAFVSGLLLLATMQMVPAPPLIAAVPAIVSVSEAVGAAGAAAGSVAGAVTAGKQAAQSRSVASRIKRKQAQNLGNAQDWQTCYDALHGHFLNFAPTGGNASHVVVSGLPNACVKWAGGVSGKINAGNPVVLSNNAIRVENLSQTDLSELQSAIDATPNPTD